MSVQVVLGFDMETDIGSWTPYYDGMTKGTPRVLEVLSKHKAKSTFFFTAEAAECHPEVMKMVDECGHEIGCHSLQHETVGDQLFPIPGLKPILPEECFHRLKVATDIVQQLLGKKMESFRAPRLWGSTAMVNALETLGYSADASYPLYYYKTQSIPYHPSSEDWTMSGGMRLLEIPNFADITLVSKDPYGRDLDQWPLFRTEGAEALIQHVDNMLSYYQQHNLPAVICMYLHPWEFHEMPQGLIHYGEGSVLPDPFIIKNCGETAVRELDSLISLLEDRQAVFLTAAELAVQYNCTDKEKTDDSSM